jgi:UV DNA damage endonuclease
MRIGYACLTVGVQGTNLRRCNIKNASEDNLLNIIEHNLNSLNNVINYNIENNIKLFRVSSDLIPFGSSKVNNIPWWDIFSTKLSQIGEKIKSTNMRVSMHPGQYTVLNSPKEEVVLRAIEDLNYHNRVMDSLGLGKENKIILHIGGVYDNKQKAIKNFILNFQLLSKDVKERLVIENDDKSYNIEEVLKIGQVLNIPVVFDNLHNQVLPCASSKDEYYWINQCKKTWKKEDGTQKIHYSQQNEKNRKGAHSNTIYIEEFMKFVEKLDDDLDIMLEVKDKNLSVIKCINSLSHNEEIKNLELEWSKYKYNVLERSNLNYNKIRKLLKNKKTYPVVEFYRLIEESLSIEEDIGNSINAMLHIWGYFKNKSTKFEKNKFIELIERYKKGKSSKKAIKKFLWKMVVKYNDSYLLKSYYFYF